LGRSLERRRQIGRRPCLHEQFVHTAKPRLLVGRQALGIHEIAEITHLVRLPGCLPVAPTRRAYVSSRSRAEWRETLPPRTARGRSNTRGKSPRARARVALRALGACATPPSSSPPDPAAPPRMS